MGFERMIWEPILKELVKWAFIFLMFVIFMIAFFFNPMKALVLFGIITILAGGYFKVRWLSYIGVFMVALGILGIFSYRVGKTLEMLARMYTW